MGLGVNRSTRVLSVSELAARIKGSLEGFGSIWVSGELTGCKRAASGHLWFSLKDDHAQLDAVMFLSLIHI